MDGNALASGKTFTSKSRPNSPLPSSSSPTPSSRDSSGEKKAKKSDREILILREELCKLVAGLSVAPPDTARVEKVSKTLQPFFDSIASPTKANASYETDESNRDELFRGITPLVIACDRGNLPCLLYFCQLLERQASSSTIGNIFWEVLIGCPLKSRTVPDKTTVFHHCTTELAIQAEQKHKVKGQSFLELLERIAIAQEKLRGGDETIHNNLILALGGAVNSHGDTPLMMAVVNGTSLEDSNGNSSAKIFLEHWYTLAIARRNPECTQLETKNIQKTLTVKNNDGRSVLSYAWVGGIVDLVQWLIDIDDRSNSSSTPIITSEDTLQFRKSLGRIGKTIQSKAQNNKATTNGYEKKQMATEECTKLLEAHVKNRSELIAQQLLEELEGDDKNSKKPTTRRKKKKKKQQPQQEPALESVENVSHNKLSADEALSETIDKDALHLTKLTNGKLAVTVPGQQETQEEHDEIKNSAVLPSAWYRKRTFSLDETNQLLRDRYKEGSTKPASAAPTNTNGQKGPKSFATTPKAPNESSDADSVLSALCLDVNCLLYSDYGMALNLSAAQLDAVEQILREQLQSVSRARTLQERRYKSAPTSSSLDSNATER